jgi:Dolichyl-phosphate-mannose-protein mannosyltransferase
VKARRRTAGAALLTVLSVASLGAAAWEARITGLRLTVQPRGAVPTLELRASEVTSDALLLDPGVPSGIRYARWDGYWLVSQGGACSLLLKGSDAARVWLDDVLLLERDGAEPYRDQKTLWLERGPHLLRAELDVHGSLPVFKLALSSSGSPRPAEGREFSPDVRSATAERLLPAIPWLEGATIAAWAVALLWTTFALRRHESVPIVLATVVVLYGGALRIEGLVRQYWGMDAPGWAREVAGAVRPMRPVAMKLSPVDNPYTGDPHGYLAFARDMRHFYAAHFREPLFVLAAKAGLAAAGGADVGVGLTSAVFSTLLVWMTYLLGSACFGRRVGLMAALLMAIEPIAVSSAAQGMRDDAFAFFVLLATLRLCRMQAEPNARNAGMAGLAGAGACLTRITSLSFLLPGLLFVSLTGDRASRRRRLRAAGIALLIAAGLVAPYLINCALVFGDPFISVDAHTHFYRGRANLPWDPSMNWLQYLLSSFRPLELVQTFLIGVTTYPFDNKWDPYIVWVPHLPLALRLLSLVGLLLFLKRREGRVLLVVLVTALVPFAFTWRVPGGSEWRFTLHAYPFYLIAAAYAFDQGLEKATQFFRNSRPAA